MDINVYLWLFNSKYIVINSFLEIFIAINSNKYHLINYLDINSYKY